MSILVFPRSAGPLWLVAVALYLLLFNLNSRADAAPLSIAQAVSQALAGNPGLAEIMARAEALAALPAQEGALPDPSLNIDLLNVPTSNFSLRKEDMTMLDFGISQTIPFPGKLALKEQAATQEALAAADSVTVARLRLARDVKQAWWRLFYFDQASSILNNAEPVFQQLLDSAQAKYRLGQGQQQDVLMAQLEYSKLKDEKLELLSMRHSLSNQLNVLLAHTSNQALVLAEHPDIKTPILDEDALNQTAMQSNPLFERHRKMLDAAKTKVDLAEKDFYPDFTLGAGYAVRQNTPSGDARSDFASVRLSINLPIYADQKQGKALDQRHSELLQEQYSQQDEHNKIHGEIAANSAQYHHAVERSHLYETELIPQAQQTVNALLAGYPLGKADFSDLLRAQLTLLQYQTQYWKSITDTQQFLAELENLTGEGLNHD